MQPKQNCWEFKQCGREPGGVRVAELGICSAAEETRANGIHGGRNAGRACWVMGGTLCGGEVQGSFAAKIGACQSCEFYKIIETQEPAMMDISDILYEIKHR